MDMKLRVWIILDFQRHNFGRVFKSESSEVNQGLSEVNQGLSEVILEEFLMEISLVCIFPLIS